MNYILFGFKCCGKTTLGKRVADALGMRFVDTDDLITALYQQETGAQMTCREIALKAGAERFRELEACAIAQLQDVQGAIIAVGGGAVLFAGNLTKLAAIGQLIYLDLDRATLKQRILAGPLPSYLDPEDVEGSFQKMYEVRKEMYERIPAAKISLTGQSADQSVDELCKLMRGSTYGK